MKHPVNWLKQFLVGFCSEAEIKNLAPGAWRHGFSNWARNHENPDVRRDAPETQDHTENVAESNYIITGNNKASNVAKQVMDSVLESGGEIVVEESASAKPNTVRVGAYFSKMEKAILVKAFCKQTADGAVIPPSTINNDVVDRACRKFPALKKLYERVKLDKKGRSQANNTIRRSLGVDKVKKKATKTMDPVEGKSSKKNRYLI